jgi:polysaccharide biosynthesis protein PslG
MRHFLPCLFLFAAIFAAPRGAQAAETTSPLNPQTYFAINGVGFFHRSDQADELRRRWELMEELGMQWDRSDLWWSDIEPEPGKWDFSKPDRGMEMYRSHGVQMLPILDYGARWRKTAAPGNDEERAEWARYVSRVVARYGDYADTWEVWNEPNILPFWRPQPDAASYAKLLEVTAEQARAANPRVRL